MKKTYFCLLWLLLLFYGCNTVTEEAIALPKQAIHNGIGTNMTVSMPENWSYEEFMVTAGDDGIGNPIYGIRLFPDAEPDAVVSITCGGLTHIGCGTVTGWDDVIYDNGYLGKVTYDNLGEVIDHSVTFPEIPGIYSVHYRFSYAQENTYGSTVDAILDNLVFADGIIRENTALLIGSEYKGEEDETVRAEYEVTSGKWIVGIYPFYGGTVPLRYVTLDKTGKVTGITELNTGGNIQ